MNISEQILDLIIERDLQLSRYASGLNAEFAQLLAMLAQDVSDQLNQATLTKVKRERLERIIAEIKVTTNEYFGEVFVRAREDLEELIADEGRWIVNTFNSAITVDVMKPLANKELLKSLLKDGLFMGAPLETWFNEQGRQTQLDFERSIRTGVSLGETNQQIVKRMFGAGLLEEVSDLSKRRRQLEALTRTAVATATQGARQDVYDANLDVIKGFKWTSTLDSRTSKICIALSDLQWTAKKKPIGHEVPFRRPPAHWRCRSVLAVVTKSFRELGLDIDEVPESTRASMDGQVPASTTFAQFLDRKGEAFKREVLGQGRYELYRDGKITLTDLIDKGTGRELTLRELKVLYG